MSKLHKVSERLTTKPPSRIVSFIDTGQVCLFRRDVVFAKSRLLVLHGSMTVDRTIVPLCFIIIIIIVFLEG